MGLVRRFWMSIPTSPAASGGLWGRPLGRSAVKYEGGGVRAGMMLPWKSRR